MDLGRVEKQMTQDEFEQRVIAAGWSLENYYFDAASMMLQQPLQTRGLKGSGPGNISAGPPASSASTNRAPERVQPENADQQE
jgi:hypothetical protein